MASIQWLWCSHSHRRPPLWDWKEKGPSRMHCNREEIQFHFQQHKTPFSYSSCCCIQEPYAAKANRRQVILQMAVAVAVAAAFAVPNAMAVPLAPNGVSDVAEDFRFYTDDFNKFKVLIPKGWQVGTGEPNGFKSVTAFYPEEPSSSNVSVVITGLGPDFTRMESFGKVEAFAETLVSGLDRSWQRPPGVAAKLIDAKAANGFYYIEYSLQNPGESCRHLYSAIGMASNGWYNRLYTVTGQVGEEETDKYGPKVQKVVASFGFI